jgi:hypothetical protein
LNALQPHHDVHRSINGTDHRGDVILARQARCIENIRTGLLIGLKPLDRVLEIGPTDQVVFCPSRQRERNGESARRFRRSADSLNRQ